MTFYLTPPMQRMWRHRMGEVMERDFARQIESEAKYSFPVDVLAESDSFVLSALLPGMKAEDLDIQIADETVTIQGQIGKDEKEEASYLLNERVYGHFSRSLTMPTALDANKTEASLKDGVLTVRIPKAEESLPRTIKVTTK
jgi:HSP20 family protein